MSTQPKPKRKAVTFVNVTEDEEAHEKVRNFSSLLHPLSVGILQSRKDGRSVKRHSTSVDGERADAAVAPAQIAQHDVSTALEVSS